MCVNIAVRIANECSDTGAVPIATSYIKLGRCEASWGEPERDMTISTRLSDSAFTETHGLENALKSEYE